MATQVVERASREKPADALLRDELKRAGLPRHEGKAAVDLVFGYFRWRGLMDSNEGINRQLQRARDFDLRFASDPNSFSTEELRRNVPEWLADEMEITREWLLAIQHPPVLWLRAKKGTSREVIRGIGNCTRGEGPLADALEYHGEKDLFRTPEFQSGHFEVQDVASQIVGLVCDPKPGQTWWDACAGEGGKLLHLSDLMQNKGLIWASDRSEGRLKRLKQRAARAKAFNYRVALWDGSERLPTRTKFDGVLVDAPCSGVGTWQRNPHARWTTTRADVQELGSVQRRIVSNVASTVKPGGKLIFAVCTLTRSETDAVADLCSPQLSGFAPSLAPALPNGLPRASGRIWIWPQTFRGNGMFLSVWERSS